MTRLFDELLQERAGGSYPRLLKKLAEIDVLVLGRQVIEQLRGSDEES